VGYVAFSPDGKQLRTGSDVIRSSPQEVIRWDVATWKQLTLTSTQPPKWPNIGVLSADHTAYAGKDGDDRMRIYDFASGKQLGQLSVQKLMAINPSSGLFSPNGSYFAVAAINEKNAPIFRLFAIPSCNFICDLPNNSAKGGALGTAVFSPDERLFAFWRVNDEILVCDTLTGAMKRRVGQSTENAASIIRSNPTIAISPDNKFLAVWTYTDNAIRVWDLTTGNQRLHVPPGEQGRRHVQLAWSPDSRMLAVADLKIQLVEVATGRIRQELDGRQGSVWAIAFSPDGRLLASGSGDTTVLIWDVWGR
jgi:WD40 repeat protein